MLKLYTAIMGRSAPLLRGLLQRRGTRGKEDPLRVGERMGLPGRARPAGKLIWLHAASVGEAQSVLALIDALLALTPAHILVTTGTVTSAQMMEKRLPDRALHQFYPLDHPPWVAAFLDHWRPDLALWTESELWPVMLSAVAARHIPAVLLNARLSERSFTRWKLIAGEARMLLDNFNLILAQTEDDAVRFRQLGAHHVAASGNLKYSAAPLPVDHQALQILRRATANRPLWLYASTHDGEEDLACRLHTALREKIPGLLTIIVPRHPERRTAIETSCKKYNLSVCLRGDTHTVPAAHDEIYIADTLGELGLFYTLTPITCIGRSFSNDGGGGHNPLEAARFGCAVLHGPHIGNLAAIYQDMDQAGAALPLEDEADFQQQLQRLLTDKIALTHLQQAGESYAAEKNRVLETVMTELTPWLIEAGLLPALAEAL